MQKNCGLGKVVLSKSKVRSHTHALAAKLPLLMNLLDPRIIERLNQHRIFLGDLREVLGASAAPENELRDARMAAVSLEQSFLLVVVGEFNSGKSSLLNALLGGEALQTGVTPTTDKVQILVHGARDLLTPYEPLGDSFVVRRELPLSFLEGVALVDTPGTNAVIRQHQIITEGFLPRADLLLFLTSSDRPFAESERQFLSLAKAWSRKVVVVINKMDLLENESDRHTVLEFVRQNALATLGETPPIFAVSARQQQRTGEDAGFAQLEAHLREVLGEQNRVRLKLLSPLGVAMQLLNRAKQRVQASQDLIAADSKLLLDLQTETQKHQDDLKNQLEAQLLPLYAVLDGVQKRGEIFIDDTLRVSKTIELLNADKVRGRFEREVVSDAPQQLERRVSDIIDRFLERNVKFWNDTVQLLSTRGQADETRAALVRGAQFDYDRQGLLERLGSAARTEIERFEGGEFARQLATDASSAVVRGGLTSVGGLGLGALVAGVFGTLLADFTGILLGAAVASVGLFILPRRREKAKQELASRIGETRERLREVLLREHALEGERALLRLQDAIAPFTRFIRTETERFETTQTRLLQFEQQVATMRADAEGFEL
jgi:small GTP-binding protein